MGLLSSIWNSFGDMYDSMQNSSNNNNYEDNDSYTSSRNSDDYEENNHYERPHEYRRPGYVRVEWRGHYLTTSGLWTWRTWEGEMPDEQYRRLANDGYAFSGFLRYQLGDVERFENETNYPIFLGYL